MWRSAGGRNDEVAPSCEIHSFRTNKTITSCVREANVSDSLDMCWVCCVGLCFG